MSLTLVIGPMFSGKSSFLIKKINELKNKGIYPYCISHASDTRYGTDSIITHDLIEEKCHSVYDLSDDLEENCIKHDYIIIEEGHFFENLVQFVKRLVRNNKHVFVAGLDGNFEMEPFLNIVSLIPFSDHVIRLTSVCSECGCNATFTKKINKTNKCSLQVGGKELYQSVCRIHHT